MRDKHEQARLTKVSLGLPVFNGERYLETALVSLLNQSFEDFEIIISDNASTDRTSEICRDYVVKDGRIRYFRNTENIGAAPNFNRTFHLSRGSLFKWVAHDDHYAPAYLERCVSALEAAPEAVLAHTELVLVDGSGAPLRHNPATNQTVDAAGNRVMPLDRLHLATAGSPAERFDDVLHRINWCSPVFGLIRAKTLQFTGLQRSYYGADKVLLAELALRGQFAQIVDALFHKRVHTQMSFQLSTAEKRRWIDPRAHFHIPQLLMLRDYFVLVSKSSMPAGQKWRCTSSILRMAARDGLWQRVFVPGPQNYLGINWELLDRR